RGGGGGTAQGHVGLEAGGGGQVHAFGEAAVGRGAVVVGVDAGGVDHPGFGAAAEGAEAGEAQGRRDQGAGHVIDGVGNAAFLVGIETAEEEEGQVVVVGVDPARRQVPGAEALGEGGQTVARGVVQAQGEEI